GHRQHIWKVVYSPDSKTLASLGEDKMIRLWDVATGKELRQLAKFTGVSRSIAYSPDGKILASTDSDATHNVLHFWDTATGKEIRRFEGRHYREGFYEVTFSPDGKLVAASRGQPTVDLWEVATGRKVYTLAVKNPTLGDCLYWPVVFSPDGRLLATPG